MINQMNANDHTENQFFHALKELHIAKLFHKSNITKSCGVSAYEVFQFLLLLIFQGKNLFRFLNFDLLHKLHHAFFIPLLWSLGLSEISKQFRTILQQKRCAHIGIFCLNVFFLSFPAIKTDVGPSDFPIIRMLSAVFSYQLIFEPFLIRIPDHLL